MRVSVYHNIAQSPNGQQIHWFGYQQGHPLVHVLDVDIDLAVTDLPDDDLAVWDLADEVWIATNAGDWLAGVWAELAAAYRHRRLRSLSVGDVVVIGDGDARRGLCVARRGFEEISPDALTIVEADQHGTHPWPTGTAPLRLPQISASGTVADSQ